MVLRMGKAGALVLWVNSSGNIRQAINEADVVRRFLSALQLSLSYKRPSKRRRELFTLSVVTTVRTAVYPFLLLIDLVPGLPDRGFFGQNSSHTQTPLRAIVFTTLVSIIPGLLDLASPIAANAIFSLTAMALDLSYIIPIFLRRTFAHHPEVMFKPGPFYMGDGLLGYAANYACILWTLFVCVIFSFPTYLPVTPQNMNYASVSLFFHSISIKITHQLGYRLSLLE